MKGTVNPFEPWRPVEARVPPPLHAGRPWRPPPPPPVLAAVEELMRAEPVKPLPRNKPIAYPKYPQRQAKQPSRRPSISQLTASVVLVVLGLLCLESVGWFRGTHLPRLLMLGISAGMFAGMAFNQRRSWYARLRGMAIALALAGIALWFVPTIHGISLWSAYRRVEELRALPAGDVAAYKRGATVRRTLVEEFPSFAAEVSAAERAWFRRTVDEAIENADQRLSNDPDAALARLHRLDKELSQLAHYASVQKELESAHRRAVLACLKVAQQR